MMHSLLSRHTTVPTICSVPCKVLPNFDSYFSCLQDGAKWCNGKPVLVGGLYITSARTPGCQGSPYPQPLAPGQQWVSLLASAPSSGLTQQRGSVILRRRPSCSVPQPILPNRESNPIPSLPNEDGMRTSRTASYLGFFLGSGPHFNPTGLPASRFIQLLPCSQE